MHWRRGFKALQRSGTGQSLQYPLREPKLEDWAGSGKPFQDLSREIVTTKSLNRTLSGEVSLRPWDEASSIMASVDSGGLGLFTVAAVSIWNIYYNRTILDFFWRLKRDDLAWRQLSKQELLRGCNQVTSCTCSFLCHFSAKPRCVLHQTGLSTEVSSRNVNASFSYLQDSIDVQAFFGWEGHSRSQFKFLMIKRNTSAHDTFWHSVFDLIWYGFCKCWLSKSWKLLQPLLRLWYRDWEWQATVILILYNIQTIQD